MDTHIFIVHFVNLCQNGDSLTYVEIDFFYKFFLLLSPVYFIAHDDQKTTHL